jgi:outer membrane autotransporter protein
MKNAHNFKKVTIGLRLLSAGAFIAGTTAFASWSEPVTQGFSDGNPSSASLVQSGLATQKLVDMLMKGVPHAGAVSSTIAGDMASEWFRTPSFFAEAAYNDTEDNRLGGFDTEIYGGTIGLNFLTKWDVAAGVMLNYGSTSGDATFPGNITDDADNFGFTLSAAKSFDWFFVGMSMGYDYNDTTMVTPIGRHLDTQADSYTLAPFIGAVYVKGNFDFATTPTLVMRWQDFNYNTAPSDNSSDTTFALINTASYNITEALRVGLNFNWNCVVDESLTRMPQANADDTWFTLGTKVTYNINDKLSAYASYSIDLDSSTYDNQRVVAGMSLDF